MKIPVFTPLATFVAAAPNILGLMQRMGMGIQLPVFTPLATFVAAVRNIFQSATKRRGVRTNTPFFTPLATFVAAMNKKYLLVNVVAGSLRKYKPFLMAPPAFWKPVAIH